MVKKNLCDGKIIHCKTEKEARILLDFLIKKGYEWCGGRTTESLWYIYEDKTCYSVNHPTFNRNVDNHVGYASIDDYIRYGCEITEFSELNINENTSNNPEYQPKNLDDILALLGSENPFLDEVIVDEDGHKQPFTESGAEAYSKLISIIYAVGNITGAYMDDIIETLDTIATET